MFNCNPETDFCFWAGGGEWREELWSPPRPPRSWPIAAFDPRQSSNTLRGVRRRAHNRLLFAPALTLLVACLWHSWRGHADIDPSLLVLLLFTILHKILPRFLIFCTLKVLNFTNLKLKYFLQRFRLNSLIHDIEATPPPPPPPTALTESTIFVLVFVYNHSLKRGFI